jgi:Domain of Unknown Function (DUF928)
MHIKTSTLTRIFSASILSVLIVSHVPNKTLAGDFEPPPRKDAPRGGTAGGGTRLPQTKCLSGKLTALSPNNQVGFTKVERPKFWVNLPKSPAKIGEFSLFDAEMRGIYQTNILLQQHGLLNLQIPSNVAPLSKNKPYYWTFALVCNQRDRTEDIVVGGWVEYRHLHSKSQQKLAKLSTIQQISQNLRQGYWYDAVESFIELQKRSSSPNPHIALTWNTMSKIMGTNSPKERGLAVSSKKQ